MSDKAYIDKNAAELNYGDKLTSISRINLAVDSDHIYISGDDTGRTLEVDCPWGSQEMADSILAKVSAADYQPYTAGDALLDPASEIGDGVTVGGIYSQISTSNIEFDKMCVSGISAPDSDEIDDEYPYEGSAQRAIERKISYTRSLIAKTSTEISLKVEDMENSLSQTLRVAADGVTITNANGDTLTIDGGQIDATKINVDDMQLTGAISWGDLAEDAQSQITSAQSAASSAQSTANSAANTASTVKSQFAEVTTTYGGNTYIDGNMIYTGSIYASSLHLGGQMSVYSTETGNTLGGYIGYCSGDSDTGIGVMNSSGTGQCICTNAGAKIAYGTNTEIIAYRSNAYISSGNSSIGVFSDGTINISPGSGGYTAFYVGSTARMLAGATSCRPYEDDGISLGLSSYKWSNIYATTSSIGASDRALKKDITYDLSKYDAFFDDLRPTQYKFIDGYGQSNRFHIGMIAQDVEESLEKCGLTSLDFAGFIKSPKLDENEQIIYGEDNCPAGYDYGLRYEEFIGLCIYEIQKLKIRIKELEAIT